MIFVAFQLLQATLVHYLYTIRREDEEKLIKEAQNKDLVSDGQGDGHDGFSHDEIKQVIKLRYNLRLI